MPFNLPDLVTEMRPDAKGVDQGVNRAKLKLAELDEASGETTDQIKGIELGAVGSFAAVATAVVAVGGVVRSVIQDFRELQEEVVRSATEIQSRMLTLSVSINQALGDTARLYGDQIRQVSDQTGVALTNVITGFESINTQTCLLYTSPSPRDS